MQFPDLTEVLGPVRWCVVGAAATRLYMPERVTDDLDILVHVADMAVATERLRGAGYIQLGALSIGGASWSSPDRFPIDLLWSDEEWASRALEEAGSNRDAQGLPILPMPYLVLMKFRAGRVQDVADVTRMLGQADEPEIERVRAVFSRWLPGELEDLESLISLGQLEFRSD
jgi:hypothetical protein